MINISLMNTYANHGVFILIPTIVLDFSDRALWIHVLNFALIFSIESDDQ
jgi:hypothetical protein